MEQIELDLVHNWLDQQKKNGNPEFFVDETYESYDNDTDDRDQRISDHSVPVHKAEESVITIPIEAPSAYGEGDWEDVD
jgi:hypothetical protein